MFAEYFSRKRCPARVQLCGDNVSPATTSPASTPSQTTNSKIRTLNSHETRSSKQPPVPLKSPYDRPKIHANIPMGRSHQRLPNRRRSAPRWARVVDLGHLLAMDYFAGRVREGVPNRQPSPILARCAFDLVGAGGYAPLECWREF